MVVPPPAAGAWVAIPSLLPLYSAPPAPGTLTADPVTARSSPAISAPFVFPSANLVTEAVVCLGGYAAKPVSPMCLVGGVAQGLPSWCLTLLPGTTEEVASQCPKGHEKLDLIPSPLER